MPLPYILYGSLAYSAQQTRQVLPLTNDLTLVMVNNDSGSGTAEHRATLVRHPGGAMPLSSVSVIVQSTGSILFPIAGLGACRLLDNRGIIWRTFYAGENPPLGSLVAGVFDGNPTTGGLARYTEKGLLAGYNGYDVLGMVGLSLTRAILFVASGVQLIKVSGTTIVGQFPSWPANPILTSVQTADRIDDDRLLVGTTTGAVVLRLTSETPTFVLGPVLAVSGGVVQLIRLPDPYWLVVAGSTMRIVTIDSGDNINVVSTSTFGESGRGAVLESMRAIFPIPGSGSFPPLRGLTMHRIDGLAVGKRVAVQEMLAQTNIARLVSVGGETLLVVPDTGGHIDLIGIVGVQATGRIRQRQRDDFRQRQTTSRQRSLRTGNHNTYW